MLACKINRKTKLILLGKLLKLQKEDESIHGDAKKICVGRSLAKCLIAF